MPSHDNAGRQTDQREHNPEFLKAMTEWVEFGEQMKKQAIMDDYARMFIAMSMNYLTREITWETYVRNTEIAAQGMRQLPSVGSVEENFGTETSP